MRMAKGRTPGKDAARLAGAGHSAHKTQAAMLRFQPKEVHSGDARCGAAETKDDTAWLQAPCRFAARPDSRPANTASKAPSAKDN